MHNPPPPWEPAPWEQPPPNGSHGLYWLAGLGVLLVAFVGAVVVTGPLRHASSPPPANASVGTVSLPTFATTATAAPSAKAPATPEPPTAPPHPTANPATVAAAGQQYLAAATQVNMAVSSFQNSWAYAADHLCKCVNDALNIQQALDKLPAVSAGYASMASTLTKIQAEVPQDAADAATMAGLNQDEITDINRANDDWAAIQAGSAASINQLSADLTTWAGVVYSPSTHSAVALMRADLGLPPPPAIG